MPIYVFISDQKQCSVFLDLDMIHKMIYTYDYHKLEGNNHFYLWTSIYHTHLKRSSHMWHLAYVKWINWMKKVIVIVFIDLKSSFTKGKSIPLLEKISYTDCQERFTVSFTSLSNYHRLDLSKFWSIFIIVQIFVTRLV